MHSVRIAKTIERMPMEQELVIKKLNTRCLFQPILMGAVMLITPLWILLLATSLFTGATINGEHVTGIPAFLIALIVPPSFVLIGGIIVWVYVSACLWAYSKWHLLRIRFVPS